MMQATHAGRDKRLAQLKAMKAGSDTFEFPCGIHGDNALSDATHGWCIECRALAVEIRAAKQERKTEYHAENIGKTRAAGAVHRLVKISHSPPRGTRIPRLPASYEAEKEAIERFYAACPNGFHVDHVVPLQGRNVSGLHTLSNLQYLPDFVNLWKGRKFRSDIRSQKPANELPGGAKDPEKTELDLRVSEMLKAIIETMKEWECKETAKARRKGIEGPDLMADDLAAALAEMQA